MTTQVSDRPAERGIIISNVLSGLMLASVIGVWNSLSDLADEIGVLSQAVAVIQAEQTLKFSAIDKEQALRFEVYDAQYSELLRELNAHISNHHAN